MKTEKQDGLIKIILCSYQGAEHIAAQILSVLEQTYSPIELHVFDDCSSDDTCLIVETFCRSYKNIFLHKNLDNLGFLRNFEQALLKISGEYIALCDQDDIWRSDKLSSSMKALQQVEKKDSKKPILVHSDLQFMDEDGHLTGQTFFNKKNLKFPLDKSLPQLMGHCGVMGNTILMNSKLIDLALPFPEKLIYHDYWLSIVNEVFGVRRTIHSSLVKYRLHATNVSNNNSKNQRYKTLPFMQDNRREVIESFLERYNLSKEDRDIFDGFYEYLKLENNRITHYSFLLKNNFFKPVFMYRVIAFFRILFARKGLKQ